MSRLRALLTLSLAGPTLAVLITVTLYEVALIWREGRVWPLEYEGSTSPNGDFVLRIFEPHIAALDWLLLIAHYLALIALQVALVYLVRRAWRALRTRT